MTKKWLRWTPAAIVPAVIAVGVLAVPLQAGAVDLPDKSAAEVLAMIGQEQVDALSGTVEQTSALGLPDLGSTGMSGGGADGAADASTDAAASALELLSGSHTARVYFDGPAKARVQVLDRLAERDVVVNGSEIWFYDSDRNAAQHVVLPADAGAADAATEGKVPGGVRTPAELANKLLAGLDASTEVTVGQDVEVAGRSAYEIVLTPKTSESLVGSIAIAVDSETGLPLRFTVQARGQSEPAFQVVLTNLSLDTPNADLFDFAPPAGATVEEIAIPAHDASGAEVPKGEALPERSPTAPGNLTVTGSGWDAVAEVTGAAVPSELEASPLFSQLTTPVDGGRLFSTALMNVYLTDDGRAFAGSVSLERLQAAAQ